MAEKAQASCLCGGVRLEFDLPTLWCAHCHCSMCRRAHGAGFVTWVGVRATHFRIMSGDDSLLRYRSSAEAVRSFCSQCGSTLLFESQKWPGEVHVVLANVETPIDREPDSHAYTEDHASWVPLWDIQRSNKKVH